MIVEVHHAAEFTGSYDPAARLMHVANIDVGDPPGPHEGLELAYHRTQNLEGSWSRGPMHDNGEPNHDYHPGIDVLAPLPVHGGQTYGHRSSSIGDVFRIEGRSYRVASMGFTLLEPAA